MTVIINGGGGGGGGGGAGGIICRDDSEINEGGRGGGGGGSFEIDCETISSTGTGNIIEFCFFLNIYFSSINKSSSVLTNPCFIILFAFDKLNSLSLFFVSISSSLR